MDPQKVSERPARSMSLNIPGMAEGGRNRGPGPCFKDPEGDLVTVHMEM